MGGCLRNGDSFFIRASCGVTLGVGRGVTAGTGRNGGGVEASGGSSSCTDPELYDLGRRVWVGGVEVVGWARLLLKGLVGGDVGEHVVAR